MKKIPVILIVAVLLGVTSNAQVRRETNPSQTKVSDTLQKTNKKLMYQELDLTEEQRNQLKAFQQEMKQKRDDITNDQNLDPGQKKDKMSALRIEQKEKLSTILSHDQLRRLMEMRRNNRLQQR